MKQAHTNTGTKCLKDFSTVVHVLFITYLYILLAFECHSNDIRA